MVPDTIYSSRIGNTEQCKTGFLCFVVNACLVLNGNCRALCQSFTIGCKMGRDSGSSGPLPGVVAAVFSVT